MRTPRVITVVVCLILAGSITVFAQEPLGWKFEITPYAWLTGIDGTISPGDRKVDLKQDVGNLIDKVDFAGSVEPGAA